MLFYVLYVSLIVLVHGRPQYDYPKPSGSFSSPSVGHISRINSENFSNNENMYNGGSMSNQYQEFNRGPTNTGYDGYNSGFSGNGYEEYNIAPSNNGFSEYNTGFSGSGYEWNNGGPSNTGYGGYFGQSTGNGYTSGPIQKHIYVQVPPPATEFYSQRRPIILPKAEKHYKIVFIKAPTAATPTVPALPQPEREEKTLVYVLVKKPDDAPEIVVPTVPPTAPSKPEVYFIKYKSKKESESSTGEDSLSMGNRHIVEMENNDVESNYRTSSHS